MRGGCLILVYFLTKERKKWGEKGKEKERNRQENNNGLKTEKRGRRRRTSTLMFLLIDSPSINQKRYMKSNGWFVMEEIASKTTTQKCKNTQHGDNKTAHRNTTYLLHFSGKIYVRIEEGYQKNLYLFIFSSPQLGCLLALLTQFDG